MLFGGIRISAAAAAIGSTLMPHKCVAVGNKLSGTFLRKVGSRYAYRAYRAYPYCIERIEFYVLRISVSSPRRIERLRAYLELRITY